MRPLFAMLIPFVVFGSVRAYALFERSLPTPPVVSIVADEAAGKFSIDLTLTFDAAVDDFALEPVSAVVQLLGKDLLRSKEPHSAGTPILLEDIDGVVEGTNTFFVKVAPAENDFASQRAVRLRVLRDGRPVVDQTLWSARGDVVEGIVEVLVPRHAASDPHEH